MASLLSAVLRRRPVPARSLLPGLSPPAPSSALSEVSSIQSTMSAVATGNSGGVAGLPTHGFLRLDRRGYRFRGVLKLQCSECRYVIRRWHIPILAVDCNANPRHKQALTNPPPRSRWSTQFPDYLAPWVEGKQYPRHPAYRTSEIFQCYHKKKNLRLR
mmetsp:Transcript_18912/g.34686  ORF Transcript_18912/g.34686 Transcript_18912/m.34686 type:complete len:159 (+) Transcript_18912:100-576(+)